MIAYLLFAVLINGDEYQVGSYPTFDACDVEAVKMLNENKDIFSTRCLLVESK